MRESKFRELMIEEFGAAYAASVARSHSLRALGATAEVLLAAGESPRVVWNALCDDFDVPEHRRLGMDPPPAVG